MAAKIKKITKTIKDLKREADQATGSISGAQARRMYLLADWIAENLRQVLHKTNGWREKP